MKPEETAISAMMKTIERKLTPPASAIEAIIKNHQKMIDPFRLGTIAALAKVPGGFTQSIAMNISKPFSPISMTALDTLSKMSDIGKHHQRMIESIALSLNTKEALLSAAFKSSSFVSAINVGKITGRRFDNVASKKLFGFLEKMRPPTLPFENLKLFNQQYSIGAKGVVNPFTETNQKFFNAIDLTILGKHSGLDSFYSSIKSLHGDIGGKLTNVLEEAADFDSETDDYMDLVASLNTQVEELKERINSLEAISPEEKQVIPFVLMLVLNFAKANGISLLSVALAIYLSYGTDNNVDLRIQEVKNEIRTSTSEVNKNQEAIIQAIGIAEKNDSIYRAHLTDRVETLEGSFIEMEEKMQQIIGRVDSLSE